MTSDRSREVFGHYLVSAEASIKIAELIVSSLGDMDAFAFAGPAPWLGLCEDAVAFVRMPWPLNRYRPFTFG
jgi:hypothetical protein